MRRAAAVTVFSVLAVGAAALPAQAATPPSPTTADSYGTVRNIVPAGQRGTINALQLAQVLLGGGLTAGTARTRRRTSPTSSRCTTRSTQRSPARSPRPSSPGTTSGDFECRRAGRQRARRPKAGRHDRARPVGVPLRDGSDLQRHDVRRRITRAPRTGCSCRTCCGTPAPARLRSSSAPPTPTSRWTTSSSRSPSTPARRRRPRSGSRQALRRRGPRLLACADAFLAGINAAQDAMCPLGCRPGRAARPSTLALQKSPTPWTRADIDYVASLVGGIFGKGGGGEYANARWLQQLQRKFGADQGRAIYDDLRERNDAEAPTTATRVPLRRGQAFNPRQAGRGDARPGRRRRHPAPALTPASDPVEPCWTSLSTARPAA